MLTNFRSRLTGTGVVMGITGLAMVVAVVLGAANTLVSGKYGIAQYENLVVAGLARGSIYALIALGYTLVYGVLRMINFAHSEVFMSGPFTAYFVARALFQAGFLTEDNPIPGLLIVGVVSMLVSMTVAVLLERIAYRPLRKAPRLVPLITAIGASFFLLYMFRGLYGSGLQRYPEVIHGEFPFLGIRVLNVQAVVIVSAIVVMLVLYFFVMRTKTGKAIRAMSEDKEVASLMGINVDRSIATTFAIGGAAAGAAGLLYALIFGQVQFSMGFVPGIKAFTAAVLGGIGNIPGAMLGGLFLGVIEALFPNLVLDGLGIVAPNQLADAVAFAMLVFVLIFRPSGILGERLATAKA